MGCVDVRGQFVEVTSLLVGPLGVQWVILGCALDIRSIRRDPDRSCHGDIIGYKWDEKMGWVGVRVWVPPLPLWVFHRDLTVLDYRRELATAAAL